ncbi:hypothetical protein VOLCADRAFT_84422 [Volvox carteri f. nagariensis]|uniref:Cupin type-2 domain-containing protein n=1 Tax=Volvox carteri f. nagariensis TaxID=3068 RepID=D8UI24_VOLCA|nr:uncharacterized protein VOLCADRAFT_84422 [Volvox carteri f. nagariensis]EFJ40623.1 hypothetical protein VOLCADRAFT_84422 [Volvox carteri f. nagariensis]|eukprot:XP_002958330.1 hypothetical protein VOLCADRAFT_84422 [Volvox carteri f. nagariensis]
MIIPGHLLLELALAVLVASAAHGAELCGLTPTPSCGGHDYSAVFRPAERGIDFDSLPGYTRSAHYADHALIAVESRVFAGQRGWKSTLTAHLVSPARGANFAMYLAEMSDDSSAEPAKPGVERFVLVLQGEITVSHGAKNMVLGANSYVYFPPNSTDTLYSEDGAGLLVYERVYAAGGKPVFSSGDVEESALLPTGPEVFKLRKLLPQTADYDFNVHIMDFQPGEYLWVKEVHYNQHGLLLLEGKGIYRLADKWYPVQAGDAIWMAPYVPQWYAALGASPTRYVIYKDTTLDPLLG